MAAWTAQESPPVNKRQFNEKDMQKLYKLCRALGHTPISVNLHPPRAQA